MRHWIFHPLVFYPLIALETGLIIAVGLRPQAWPRAATPVSAEVSGRSLIFEGDAFNAPDDSQDQEMYVTRDFWGRALTLRIAVLPNQPPPTPAEQGVRILLAAEQAALIDGKPVTVEVSYLPSPVNTAHGLAVSLQGIGPAVWVTQPVPQEPGPGVLRFELPAQFATNAIGLRVLSEAHDINYVVEITRIVVTPRVTNE